MINCGQSISRIKCTVLGILNLETLRLLPCDQRVTSSNLETAVHLPSPRSHTVGASCIGSPFRPFELLKLKHAYSYQKQGSVSSGYYIYKWNEYFKLCCCMTWLWYQLKLNNFLLWLQLWLFQRTGQKETWLKKIPWHISQEATYLTCFVCVILLRF